MHFSRRSFLAASALVGTLGRVSPAEAWIHGSATGRKGQVNLNEAAIQYDYGYINLAKGVLGFGPTGGIPSADPWALINSDGYPTAICAGTSAWRADTFVYYIDAESFFSGSVSGTTLTVTGSVTGKPLFVGQTITQTAGGTALTAQSRISAFGTGSGGAGTYTLSQSSSSTGAINMQGFIPWVGDWVGNVTMSMGTGSNGSTTSTGVAIGTNRVEVNASAIDRVGATFNLSLTAGSSTATLSSIVGTLFPLMRITGPGIPPYTTLGFGSGTSWPLLFNTSAGDGNGGGTLSYTLTNIACTGAPIAAGDPIGFTTQMTAITTTPSNLRVYRQDEEALLNAGKMASPHFISFYKQYGRLRFMNWQKTNGSMLANWEDRTPLTHVSYSGLAPVLADRGSGTKYAGKCTASTKNAYVGLTALPGNPSVWTDKMTCQFSVSDCPAMCNFVGSISGNTLTVSSVISGSLRIGLQIRAWLGGINQGSNNVQTCNITAGSGTSWTIDGSAQTIASGQMLAYAVITGMSNANPCVVTCTNHGLSTNDVITIPFGEISGGNFNNLLGGFTGPTGTNFTNSYTVTNISANTFSINVDTSNTTTWGTYSSGGIFYYAPTFKTGSLPAKLLTSIGLSGFSYGSAGNFQSSVTGPISAVYDATLDILICGLDQQWRSGLPPEAAVQLANEINGPDAWLCVPAFATDSFVNSLATYINANLHSPLKWCFELSNEVWGGVRSGFWQTVYAQAIGQTKWASTITDGTAMSQWFGWRWYNMIQQVNSVYGTGGNIVRIFSFRTDDTDPSKRYNPPAVGLPAVTLTLAQEICFANYISPSEDNQTLPAAVDIYNYQQGVLTNNNTLIQSALNGMDAAFAAFSCGPLFAPVTATIDNGSGSAGNILTVTAISPGSGFTAPSNPRIGPYSVVGVFGSSNPAVGTYVDHQLTVTGGVPNKTGTYQLNGPAQLISPATTFTIYGGWIDRVLRTFLPAFIGLANTYGLKVCAYEGGFGDLPGHESVYSSYLGNPINIQDAMNLTVAYQASSQFATTYLNYLNAWKAAGAVYSSQYCLTSLEPATGGSYGLAFPNIFGAPLLAKTNAWDIYNAS